MGLHGFYSFFDVTAQHNVRAPAGHIGGDGDHAGTTRLGNDVGLFGVLLGIEHLVRQLGLLQQAGNDFRVFNGGGAHQNGLPTFMAFANIGNCRHVFFGGGFVDTVVLVVPAARLVGRNDHGF